MESKDYIDFGQIKEFVGVKDDYLFIKYLKEIYKDLADRSDSDKKKGILKMTFFDYIKLPIFISENSSICKPFLSPKVLFKISSISSKDFIWYLYSIFVLSVFKGR